MLAHTVETRKILESPIPAFIIKEIREALPAILFFGVGFNLVVLTTQLILDDYAAQFAGFMVATTAALLVGKAVLVAKVLPFFRRFDNAPLIQPILFKTVVYWAVVFLARFLEKLIEYLLDGGRIGGIPEYVATHFTWHRFAAIQILDLRSVPDFRRRRRTEHVVRSRRVIQNLLYPALVAAKADPPPARSHTR
jgi:hypothetical protein